MTKNVYFLRSLISIPLKKLLCWLEINFKFIELVSGDDLMESCSFLVNKMI